MRKITHGDIICSMRRAVVFKNSSVQCLNISPPKLRSESDILVRVHAAGVNPLDKAMTQAGYGSALLYHLRGADFVIGQEFSGVCTFVGKNVMDVRVGDEVYGAVDPWSRCGTLTDELCVNETDVGQKPHTLSHERAASLPFAIMTVWRPVIEFALKVPELFFFCFLFFKKQNELKQKKARSALVWGGRGNVGSVCAALLRDLVPQMKRVVVVGREGLQVK
jgi:NADPH:quinone reductase-like Zn-dependent oxidoreductase